MKIVAEYSQDIIYNGLIVAWSCIEPQTAIWYPQSKPMFDMMDELKPDILICHTMSNILPIVLHEYKDTQVIFRDVGRFQEIDFDLLWVPKEVSPTILKNIRTPHHQLYSAANLGQYRNGSIIPQYACDLFHLSNTQPPNNDKTNMNIHHALHYLTSLQKYKVRICGPYSVPLPEYVGQISIKETVDMLMSSTITLDFNENIVYDAAINKCFCLSNIENPCCPHFTDEEELSTLVEHYIGNISHRRSLIKKAYNVAKNRTHFHQLAKILKQLNYSTEAEKSLNMVDQLL